MSKQKDLIKSTAILAIGRLSSQMIGFLLLPLYTYYLSPTEYGFVDLIVVYMYLLVPTLTLQLEMASFRYLVDARASEMERKKVISNIFYMTGLLASPWIIGFAIFGILTGFAHTWTILLAGVTMLCSNLEQQIARGLGDNRHYAIASVLIGITTLLGALVFIVCLGLRIDGVLLSITVANIAATLYLAVQLKLYRHVRLGLIDRGLQREILGYSTPLVPNGIAWWAINASDRTIISIMISTAANGIYAVASKYALILNSFNSILNMSWTESASIHIDAPDRDKFFSQVANATVRMFGVLGLGLIAAISLIFPFMVDGSFYEAYLYIPIMIIGVFFSVVVGLYSAIYVAKKLTKQVMNTSLLAAALNIALTVLFIPFSGLYAAAFATAAAFLAMAIFRHYDVKKYVLITYEKNLFITLVCLYATVLILYYQNTLWTNILNVAIALVATLWLNRRELRQLKLLAMEKLSK